MSEKCRFCGSLLARSEHGTTFFQCDTMLFQGTEWYRDPRCSVRAGERFESIFEVLPWDDSPITEVTCRVLGMEIETKNEHFEIWRTTNHRLRVVINRYKGRLEVAVVGRECEKFTAGQLACFAAVEQYPFATGKLHAGNELRSNDTTDPQPHKDGDQTDWLGESEARYVALGRPQGDGPQTG